MLKIYSIRSEQEFPAFLSRSQYVDFLHEHLGKYRDPKQAIDRAIEYAFGKDNGKGGFLLAAFLEEKLVGALIMNETGMGQYIPENILVYVAVDASQRGQGIGRQIVERALAESKGDVALHVEYDNPAYKLYEKIGFTSKYAEMRYKTLSQK